MKNACLDAALSELEKAGVRDIEQAHGGKHLQVRWRVNGGESRFYSLAKTPSDHRAPANVRADVRRILRQDGVLMTEVKLVSPRPKTPDRVAILEQRVAALEQAIRQLKGSNNDDQ